MKNQAQVAYNNRTKLYEVIVNEQMIYDSKDINLVKLIGIRLNRIFNDSNRDLDFITPSFYNGKYIVCCPKVRRNVNEVTYLYDRSGGFRGWRNFPQKLYEPTNWVDSRIPAEQTAIMEIEDSVKTPWDEALKIANLIRGAVKLNFEDASGSHESMQLFRPQNNKDTIDLVIADTARCDYYGVPCQGIRPGTHSPCPEIGFNAENILNTTTEIGEVLHPQDLTAAITSSNEWSSMYMNKYIKVTNIADPSKSIVVRVTDRAPRGKGIELTYRAWVELGRPAGNNTVKLELME